MGRGGDIGYRDIKAGMEGKVEIGRIVTVTKTIVDVIIAMVLKMQEMKYIILQTMDIKNEIYGYLTSD